jgi:lipoate-protein ligase A
MAADAFLLDHADRPTLRLYQWDGPWLSLGYAQKPLPVEIPSVRRPSGGRAVLHHHEITYAVALPEFEGTLEQIYAELSGHLLASLSRLNPGVTAARASQSGQRDPSCYQLSQRGEIQLDGRKLVGSAQLRRGRRLLQHGSIPTGIDQALFARIFPGARLPATFGPLTAEQIAANFPHPLSRQDWSLEEVACIEENACFHRA